MHYAMTPSSITPPGVITMHSHSCTACSINGPTICVAAGLSTGEEPAPFLVRNQLVSSSTQVVAATATQNPHDLQQLMHPYGCMHGAFHGNLFLQPHHLAQTHSHMSIPCLPSRHADPYQVQAPDPLCMEVPASTPTHFHSHAHIIQYPHAHVHHHQHVDLGKALCICDPTEEPPKEAKEEHFEFASQSLLRCSSRHASPPLHLTMASQHHCKSNCHCVNGHCSLQRNSMISENIHCSDHQPHAYDPSSRVHCMSWHHCNAHVNAPQSQCSQVATHGGVEQERPCYAAPMLVDVPELTCVPTASAPVDVHWRACLSMKSVDDASNHVLQNMGIHVENVRVQMATTNGLPADLIAHTRELHSVWWGGGASVQALPEDINNGNRPHDADGWKLKNQAPCRNVQENQTYDGGSWKLEDGVEQAPKPSGDVRFRKEAQKERRNCWNYQSKNRKRRRYFPGQRSANASTWDGPSTSNVGTMSDTPSRFKDADGWGNGSNASEGNACWDQANGSAKGTAREPVDLFQTENEADLHTMTCPSSYVGWTDSSMELHKVCKEPVSADAKENNQGMQLKNASPTARGKCSAETPPSNTESTWLGAIVNLAGSNIQASCPPKGTSTREEYIQKLPKDEAQVPVQTTTGLNMVNQTMDFLSSSSDDRDFDICLLYESDDGYYPVDGTDNAAKIQENHAYEFFMQIFEENEELKKRYKEQYALGEFDCLVCSNIPNKPIKRYNGLVSVVMHAKKILNTKRRHDHRGFARAICDFMGWDVYGNPIVRPLENIQPRACLLEPESIPEGDKKISSDSEDELVGGRDSISPEKKPWQDEEASQALVRPFENNVTMQEESHIAYGVMEDGNAEGKWDTNEVFRPLVDKSTVRDESHITGCVIKGDNAVPGDNEEDKFVTKGERTSSQDYGATQEGFRPFKEDITVLEESFIFNGVAKEDSMLADTMLKDDVNEKLATTGGSLSLNIGAYPSEGVVQEVSTSMEDNATMLEECGILNGSMEKENTVLENKTEDKLVIGQERLSLEVNICEDEETIAKVCRPVEDNTSMSMLEKGPNDDNAIKEDKFVLEEDDVEDKLVGDVALRSDACSQDKILENNTRPDANQVDIEIINNDAGDDEAKICLQSKGCQDKGSSDQACAHLKGIGIAMEGEETADKDGNDTHVLGEIRKSLHPESLEAGQDVVRAFREQLLDKTFGLDRNFKKDVDNEEQEMAKGLKESTFPELGRFEHEKEGDEGERAMPLCDGDAMRQ